MKAMKAIDVFKAAIRALEFEREVSALCSNTRRIDESDLGTLKRLIDERHQLLRLIDDLGIVAPAYDWGFKEWPGPVAALRQHLKLAEDKPTFDTYERRRKQEAEANSFEFAERMANLWMERAAALRAAEKT